MPGLMEGTKKNPMAGKPMEVDDPARAAPPEEQKIYDKFVEGAMKLIYNEKANAAILKILSSGGDPGAEDANPVQGLAQAAVMVVTRVKNSADQAKQDIPWHIVIHAGAEILEDLANLAKEAGIHEYGEDELESASYLAMDIYREQNPEAVEAEADGVQDDWALLNEADETGQLDHEFPELQKMVGGGGQQPPPEQGTQGTQGLMGAA